MVLNKEKINKIFIRESNWIGDAVMTTPAISSIKKSFPHAKLSVAANPYVAEVLRYNPCIDEFLVFASKNSKDYKTYSRHYFYPKRDEIGRKSETKILSINP